MITIEEVVDAFREYIREISDDSKFTDQYLYYVLNICRTEIVYNYINDNKEISPWYYQRFCIKLCPSSFMECNCEPFDVGCSVYRSVKPIPKPFRNAINEIMQVSELMGDSILPIRETAKRFEKYRKYRRKFYYMIGDYNGEKYLYIISKNKPSQYLKIEGVFEDPSIIPYVSCNEENCFDVVGTGFSIDLHRLNGLFKMAIEHLNISKKLTEDTSNNTDSSINDLQI